MDGVILALLGRLSLWEFRETLAVVLSACEGGFPWKDACVEPSRVYSARKALSVGTESRAF